MSEELKTLFNEEAERLVAGCLVSQPERLADAQHLGLLPEHFHCALPRAIYSTALRLRSQQKDPDIFQVVTALRESGELQRLGGSEAIYELSRSGLLAVPALEDYIQLILDKTTKRDLLVAAAEISQNLQQSETSVQENLEFAEGRIWEIRNRAERQKAGTGPQLLADIGVEAFDATFGDQGAIIRTGLTGFDDLTGIAPGRLIVVGGKTNSGKSQFAAAVSYSLAKQGYPVLFYSLEMPKVEVYQRFWARDSLIDSRKIQFRKVTLQREIDRLVESVERLSKLPLSVQYRSGLSIEQVRTDTIRAKRKPALIVFDYIQRAIRGAGKSRFEELTSIVRGLKNLTLEFELCVLAISSLNREYRHRSDQRVQLSDYDGAGPIEFEADQAWGINSSNRSGYLNFELLKNRCGPRGTFEVKFDKRYCLFQNQGEAAIAA